MKFLAAVVQPEVEDGKIVMLFGPLQREVNNAENGQSSEELQQLTKDVVDHLKSSKSLGAGRFSQLYGEACQKAAIRKHQKQAEHNLKEANNPELVAQRKIKRNERVTKRRASKVRKEMEAVKSEKRKKVLRELDDL